MPEFMEQLKVIFAVAGALFLLFLIFAIVLVQWRGRKSREFPYQLKPVLTQAEEKFFTVLQECAPPDTLLLSKIRLADFLEVTIRGKGYLAAFNPIARKHADFLLIDPKTNLPLLIIELDDSSHRRSQRTMESDEFKNAAFRAANVPLLRTPVRKTYDRTELRREIEDALR